MALATGLSACLIAGITAGVDAGGHIDRFYISPQVHEARPRPVVESAPYDWDQPPVDGATWASATQGQSVAIIGTARGDGSDLTAIDRAVERAGPVRVHRSRPVRIAPAVEQRDVIEQPEGDAPAEPSPAT